VRTELACEIAGPPGAPPLVLLNAVGASTEMWAPQLGALREQFRVIGIDTRGHGSSPPAPPGTHCDIAELGRDVVAALDRIGEGRVHLAGLSLGGMVAMWIAAHHPERVHRLGLICTSAHVAPGPFWLERATLVRRAGLSAIQEPVVARWITPALAQRDPELVGRLTAMLLTTDAESYAQCCEAFGSLDLRADLPRIAAPTLVIATNDDPATPPDHSREIVAGIAGSRLELLDDAAHLATVEQGGVITVLLLEHFGATVPKQLGELPDRDAEPVVAGAEGLAAAFQGFLSRYAWGEGDYPGLSRRERSIVTLTALTTIGAEHELAAHVRGALTNGLTPDEVSEVLMHAAVYAGVPRANQAYAVAQRILREQTP
jgi:3-oxoadipate enol-lactonase / 4-carboxymuconolactone decarboxylase